MQQQPFRRLRTFRSWPSMNPVPFDPRSSIYIPEGSVEARHIASVSASAVLNIGIKAFRSSNQSIPTGTETAITFNSVRFAQGMPRPSGSTFTAITIPRDGIYLLSDVIEWEANSTGGRNNRIVVNGSPVERDVRAAHDASSSTVTAIRRLRRNDTVGVEVRQSSGGALNVLGGEDNCGLVVFYLGKF